jgi:tRNA(Ile)-lysidine synthase
VRGHSCPRSRSKFQAAGRGQECPRHLWVLGTDCCTISLVRGLAERVLHTIRKRELIRPGDRVAVAVSGGADSVALLLLLAELRPELGIVLSVAHVNHKLRGAESDADERFVEDLARRLGLELAVASAPVDAVRSGIEAAAREQRYEFFRDLARTKRVGKIATGHTLDDQAETVLLRIFRGTGIRGLAGILPRLTLENEGQVCGEVVRPALGVRRAEVREFLRERGQEWREDSSNQDLSFQRNRVRLRVLPALRESFGESVVDNLADLAEIARAEEEQWSVVNGQWAASTQYPVPGTRRGSTRVAGEHSWAMGGGTLDLGRLLALPLAARRRLVRGWIEANAPAVSISFRLIEEVLDLAAGDAGSNLQLPGGRVLRVKRGELQLEAETAAADYEYQLSVPGALEVCELGVRVEAVLTSWDAVPDAERERLLDPGKVGGVMRVRNWRAGDRFWPASTKKTKKVKELLSDKHVVGLEKKLWPVVEAGGELVWVRGFAAPETARAGRGAPEVLWIREAALGSPSGS